MSPKWAMATWPQILITTVTVMVTTFESLYYNDIVLLMILILSCSLCNYYTVLSTCLIALISRACSNFVGSLNYPTYVNDALGHKSHIDHLLSHPVFGISYMVVTSWLNRV